MKPLADCRLYTFVDTAYLNGRAPESVARQLCDGGSDLIQLRAKTSSRDEIREMAEAIIGVTRQAGAGLVINDYPGIAREIGAEFCHLGQEDFFDAGFAEVSQLEVKNARSSGVKTGLSSHSVEQAARAVNAGADYIAVGPVYATATKPGRKAVTLEYVRWAARNVKVPWFAIGGINLKNVDDVLAAGARRICVVSAILNEPDAAKACREFRERLGD
ncbi:MAG: thiamine phosphate synthase [Limisphaerales bacterium]